MFSLSSDNTTALFDSERLEQSFQMDPAFAYNEHQNERRDNFFYREESDQDNT